MIFLLLTGRKGVVPILPRLYSTETYNQHDATPGESILFEPSMRVYFSNLPRELRPVSGKKT